MPVLGSFQYYIYQYLINQTNDNPLELQDNFDIFKDDISMNNIYKFNKILSNILSQHNLKKV